MSFINWIKKQIDQLLGSFDNKPGGWSSKKLTAFGAFMVSRLLTYAWAVWAFIHNNWDLLPIVIGAWMGIIYGVLRINSKEKEKGIANLKEDKDDTSSNS